MSSKRTFRLIIGILGILFAVYEFYIAFTTIDKGFDWFKIIGGILFLALGISNIYKASKKEEVIT
jgi:hypothetical protein